MKEIGLRELEWAFTTSNPDTRFRVAVVMLQCTFEGYKEAVRRDLECLTIDEDGRLRIMGDSKARKEDIEALASEVKKLMDTVMQLREEKDAELSGIHSGTDHEAKGSRNGGKQTS